jgi:hypothetical protein
MEGEPFGGLQFLVMLGVLVVFFPAGEGRFFQDRLGSDRSYRGYVTAGLAVFFFVRKSGISFTALKGTRGLIGGEVKRFDEREQVFARNRSLPPGSKEHETFYKEHPEYEAYDTRRRKKGGPLGRSVPLMEH